MVTISMSSVAQHLLTAEEFWETANSKRRELVHGEVVENPIPGALHGGVVATVSALLGTWANRVGGEYIGIRAGYILTRNPDTVLGPDVSYLRADRIPPEGVPMSFWDGAPDFAGEVISPADKQDELQDRIRLILDAGTPLVWTIHPDEREVVAHTPDGLARTYGEDDILEHPDVLPGFSCKVSELFE